MDADEVFPLLQRPDFCADAQMLEWSKRDHNVKKATTDVTAAVAADRKVDD